MNEEEKFKEDVPTSGRRRGGIHRWKAGTRLPEGAVIMRPDQIKRIIQREISAYPSLRETFLLRHEPHIANGASAITSSYLASGIYHAFTSSRKMPPGFLFLSLFTSCIPTFVLQNVAVKDQILTGSGSRMLTQTASSIGIQTFFGVIYPCLMVSYKVFTSEFNSYAQKGNISWFPKTLLENKKLVIMFCGCLAGQALLGATLPYFTRQQYNSFVTKVFGSS
ncbi:uncharacterized protein LOC133174727 [Saccostrea echinata]|uniref:uncharacterized protein LOC133174727 n=1 Tax=Saccostrea echinata TaxID=191078 RepID=UPI002A81C63E|nr:uncharacterized protein LOC133174727 [Saccostrea echinata]